MDGRAGGEAEEQEAGEAEEQEAGEAEEQEAGEAEEQEAGEGRSGRHGGRGCWLGDIFSTYICNFYDLSILHYSEF